MESILDAQAHPRPASPPLPELAGGDLIFIRVATPLFLRVAQTCGSWENHVGIVLAKPDGSWEVAESRFPRVTLTPLAAFLARSERGRYAVRRFTAGLNKDQLAALRAAAQSRLGRWYDLGFNYDSRRLYCSKFVMEVYQAATGTTVGTMITFREMLAANPSAPVGFWRLWFFGRIPWQRRCVTTTNLLKSPAFYPVFDWQGS